MQEVSQKVAENEKVQQSVEWAKRLLSDHLLAPVGLRRRGSKHTIGVESLQRTVV